MDATLLSGEVRVAIATLGCKVNRADTLRLEESLPSGVKLVPFRQRAELYVINTCTVTGAADRESRQLIARAHRLNPSAPILVTGCLAELRPEELASRDGVAEVVPNAGKDTLLERILAFLPGLSSSEGPGWSAPSYQYRPREVMRPPLKIQDGCSGRCTYCTVWAARGEPRSLPPEEVHRALARYGEQGCPEVVLSGIDLGSYGLDLAAPTSLAALLLEAAARAPSPMLRLSSLEVHRVDGALLSALVEARGRLCSHLHLPLQSGADPVLGRMRRPYDRQTFSARWRAIGEALPGACLGADVIAGFPGETGADHLATLELLEELAPAYLHVFPFSPRPGTAAELMGEAVSVGLRRDRAAELRSLSDRLWLRFRQAQEGRETTGVVYFRRSRDRLTAFTELGFEASLDGPDELMGKRVRLLLGPVDEDGMEGRLLLE
jgi:threonylcarbamoyladenosine tRNA methylthiotransferase MtaB